MESKGHEDEMNVQSLGPHASAKLQKDRYNQTLGLEMKDREIIPSEQKRPGVPGREKSHLRTISLTMSFCVALIFFAPGDIYAETLVDQLALAPKSLSVTVNAIDLQGSTLAPLRMRGALEHSLSMAERRRLMTFASAPDFKLIYPNFVIRTFVVQDEELSILIWKRDGSAKNEVAIIRIPMDKGDSAKITRFRSNIPWLNRASSAMRETLASAIKECSTYKQGKINYSSFCNASEVGSEIYENLDSNSPNQSRVDPTVAVYASVAEFAVKTASYSLGITIVADQVFVEKLK